MMSKDPASPQQQSMTDSARAKLQDVWTSLRSIKVDGEDIIDSKMGILTKWTPRSTPSEDNKDGGGGTALETMVRTMFGSCTLHPAPAQSDDVVKEEVSESVRSSRENRSRSGRRRSSSSHARAEQAVQSIREKAEQRQTSPSQRKPQVSRPFSQSSPGTRSRKHQGTANLAYVVQEVQVAPPLRPHPSDDPDKDGTFDDGISAISAHTLEELDRQNRLKMLKNPLKFAAVHSDLTHDDEEAGFEALIRNSGSNGSSLLAQPPQGAEEEEERDCVGEQMITTPINFARGQSNNTWGSKGARTLSSESTDFENVWRQQEQKYWEETVENDQQRPKKGPRRGRLSARKLRMVRKSSRDSVSVRLCVLHAKFNDAYLTLSSYDYPLLLIRIRLHSSKMRPSPLHRPRRFQAWALRTHMTPFHSIRATSYPFRFGLQQWHAILIAFKT